MPSLPKPDPYYLSDEDQDADEAEQERSDGCDPQQCPIKDRMCGDQSEQGVVQALKVLPAPGFKFS